MPPASIAHPADEQAAPVDPAFDGFGRIADRRRGRFAFTTVMPGRVPGPDGTLQAPHLAVGVLARGVLTRLVTRLYFEDEPANRRTRCWRSCRPGRRATLIARRDGANRYRFDIVLQGRGNGVLRCLDTA